MTFGITSVLGFGWIIFSGLDVSRISGGLVITGVVAAVESEAIMVPAVIGSVLLSVGKVGETALMTMGTVEGREGMVVAAGG